MVSRRKFSEILGSSLLLSALRLEADELEEPSQKVHINLPAYRLRLAKGNEVLEMPIAIGKGARDRKETPVIDGFLTEKRRNMVIRYGKDYPEQGIVKGDIITWDRTYDAKGRRVERKMPYKQMRAIQMILKAPRKFYDMFVIHSSTDEFTLGTPSSSGCIRVGIEDMLRMYNAVAPEINDGKIPHVPVSITYDVVEVGDMFPPDVVFHANIYHKDLDYVVEFRKAVEKVGINPDAFDHAKVKTAYDSSKDEFERAYDEILKTLDKSWPKNYVEPEVKERLHKRHHLYEFLP